MFIYRHADFTTRCRFRSSAVAPSRMRSVRLAACVSDCGPNHNIFRASIILYAYFADRHCG
jgi:hypothetical protein